MNEVPQAEWAALYAAVAAFYDLAPWQWMNPYQMFAVANPENGEVAYCAVIGNSQRGLGLTAFIGPEGWKFLRAVRTPKRPSTEETVRYGQRSLVLTFESSTQLDTLVDAVDKDHARQFHWNPNGSLQQPQTWPVFRSYQPGFVGWYLNRSEVSFFTCILEQAVAVTRRVSHHGQLLNPVREGTLLTRVPSRATPDSGAIEWTDAWTEVPRGAQPQLPPVWVDARRVKQAIRGAQVAPPWEVDLAFAPHLFTQSGRPRFPRLLMCVDSETGTVHEVADISGSLDGQAVTDRLLLTISRLSRYPSRFVTARADVTHLVTPLAAALGSQVVEHYRLPMLEKARATLFRQFDK